MKWFAANRTPDPSLAPALAMLDRVVRDHPDLAGPGESLGAILRVLFGERNADEPEWRPSGSEGDVPLFVRKPPPIDRDRTLRRAVGIAKALRSKSGPAALFLTLGARGAAAFADLAGRRPFGGPVSIDPDSPLAALPPTFVRSLIRLVLPPELSRLTSAPAPPGPHGECGYCGEDPILAESRGLERGRFLRCGLCGSESRIERLGCPRCGEADHRRLRFLSFEGENERRGLLCCDGCGLRLKILNTLDRLDPASLLVAELELTHLDFIEPDAD